MAAGLRIHRIDPELAATVSMCLPIFPLNPLVNMSLTSSFFQASVLLSIVVEMACVIVLSGILAVAQNFLTWSSVIS